MIGSNGMKISAYRGKYSVKKQFFFSFQSQEVRFFSSTRPHFWRSSHSEMFTKSAYVRWRNKIFETLQELYMLG